MRAAGVQHNTYALELLGSWVTVATSPSELTLEIHEVRTLGFDEGATLDRLVQAASQFGLGTCPLEAALHLRLRWMDQAQGPQVTVLSPRPTPDETQPRGFYLRRDESGLWLRGYVASDDWGFGPDEQVVLARRSAQTPGRGTESRRSRR